jgi:phage tail sheath gpL-like
MPVGFSLVPSNAVASGVFVEQQNVKTSFGSLIIPHKILLLGQYNSGKTPTNNVPVLLQSADHAAQLYGNGSMLHRMAIAAFKGAGAVPIYSCPLADGTTAMTKTITMVGNATSAGTVSIFIAGIKVTASVSIGDTPTIIASAISAAINAKTELPVTAAPVAGVVTLTCRWRGATGNEIDVSKDLDSGDSTLEPTGTTVTVAAGVSGATDPTPDAALAALGDTWYTFIASPYQLAASITALETAWTTRADPSVKRPFVGLLGAVSAYATALALANGRNSPGSCFVSCEGSPTMPLEIAAAAAGVCSNSAQADPARPWKTLTLPGVRAGTPAEWTYANKQAAELAGLSVTSPQLDGTVRIFDLVTTYKTNSLGAADDAWRYPETITNIQAKIYSLDNLFRGTPFDRAVVVDDSTVSGKSYVISPKRVKAFVVKLIDDLWAPNAWSRYRDQIVASLTAEINASNPGRIDVSLTDYPAAGLRIVAVLYKWSFGAPSNV